MAPKTTKKTTMKHTTRKAAERVEPSMSDMLMAHECRCGAGCPCGCHGGCKFCRVVKKIIVFAIIFALGFAACKFCCCGHRGMPGPRAHFVNGCLDVTEIKCPKMQAALPAMDINQDGCITREEYKVAKRNMRREIRENAPDVEDM